MLILAPLQSGWKAQLVFGGADATTGPGDSANAGAGAAISATGVVGDATAETTVSMGVRAAIAMTDDGDTTTAGIAISSCASCAEVSGDTMSIDVGIEAARSDA